jgi:hypothetical protein
MIKVSASKKKFLTGYSTISVMLAVSLIQFVLIRKVHISPWKGGGFGMFSTINTPISHIVRVYNYSPSGEKQRIFIPEKLKPMETKIRHLAIEYYISNFKEAIKNEEWILKKEAGNNAAIIIIKEQADAGAKTIALNNISVELWQYKFDPKNKKLYSTIIAKY